MNYFLDPRLSVCVTWRQLCRTCTDFFCFYSGNFLFIIKQRKRFQTCFWKSNSASFLIYKTKTKTVLAVLFEYYNIKGESSLSGFEKHELYKCKVIDDNVSKLVVSFFQLKACRLWMDIFFANLDRKYVFRFN